MLVDAGMTVDRSHNITEKLTLAIREHYPDTVLTIHIEPCRGDCAPGCSSDCLLNTQERQAIASRYP